MKPSRRAVKAVRMKVLQFPRYVLAYYLASHTHPLTLLYTLSRLLPIFQATRKPRLSRVVKVVCLLPKLETRIIVLAESSLTPST